MKRMVKGVCIFLSMIIFISTLSVLSFAEGPQPIDGDLDSDGLLTTDDARIVLRMAAGIESGAQYAEKYGQLFSGMYSAEYNATVLADMNKDGKITTYDAILVLYAASGITLPPKTGDNLISTEPDNEFIALVSSRYNVNPQLLVAIYAVPDKGNNFVLQFDGTKDALGNYVKSPETLKKVYQIDLERKVSIATGKASGNVGCTYAESYVIFELVKTMIMPQHPGYFTGIDEDV